MNPRWRNWLVAGGSSALAVWLGWQVAHGTYLLPALAGVIALAAILVRAAGLSADTILVGLLLVGYIVGNRGFAQIMPLPGVPLFPAECGLAAGLGWLLVRSALRHRLPGRSDFLNWALVVWLLLGTTRLVIDVPRYGLGAVRDYAMIYYAAFFFVAQSYAGDRHARRYLIGCLCLAAVSLLPVYFLFQDHPMFFLNRLTLRGVPLIYLKYDLAAAFLAAGSLIVFFAAGGRHRLWAWPLAVSLFLTVAAGDNRASLVGVGVAMLWLLAGRRWTFPAVQVSSTATFLAIVAILAASGTAPWARQDLNRMVEKVASIVSVGGTSNYHGVEELYKSDNNQFRLVWWRTVADETWSQAPLFGLGFGHDLARDFIQTYDLAMDEDFTARSPHSVLVTTFGRMGAVGLAAFLAIIIAMAVSTWRTVSDRATDAAAVGLWCAAWVILVSACFGVVLEGPMGAVVFWTTLGLAHGTTQEKTAASDPVPASRRQPARAGTSVGSVSTAAARRD